MTRLSRPESPPVGRTIKPKEKPPKRSQADKRIDFLLKKHFDDDPDFRPLLLKLAKLDPTSKKTYLAWIVKHWTGDWKSTEADCDRVAEHLKTHLKGTKYFSPLTWTGLSLEEEGYQADIFRYTPDSLESLDGPIAEIIQRDEEDKQIRKGNLVVTGGAEVAYKDERWTLLRVRTREALRRLGQGTSWCVRNGHLEGYKFPFDFLINNEGERFLANKHQIRDRWDKVPTPNVEAEIDRVRALGGDSYDRARAQVKFAIKAKKRHDADEENRILQFPDLAIWYAKKVIRGQWVEFEKSVRVAKLSATLATEYAVTVLRKRWPRFENKIKRSYDAKWRYRHAFPGSIPKTEEEVFYEKRWAWRETTGFKTPFMHWSVGWQAESRLRNLEFEKGLLNYAETSINRYAKIIASLATSEIAHYYSDKVQSYFQTTDDEPKQAINLKLGPLIQKWM